MRLKLTTALAWTTFALTACPVGAPQVDGANITCAKDSDCLAGEVCDPTYELCIAGPSTDGGPSVCVINGKLSMLEPSTRAALPDLPARRQHHRVLPAERPHHRLPRRRRLRERELHGRLLLPRQHARLRARERHQRRQPMPGVHAQRERLGVADAQRHALRRGHLPRRQHLRGRCLRQRLPHRRRRRGRGDVRDRRGLPGLRTRDERDQLVARDRRAPTGVCASGQVCNAGSCSAGCYVGGTFEAPGPNPASSCQSCVPSSLLSGWTDAADGTACSGNGGHFCQSGVCADLCDIGGQLFNNGAANPANGCQACEVANSDTSFSSVTGAVTCNTGGGDYCVAGTCSSACAVGTTVVASGTPEQSNPCQTCQPDVSKSAYSSLPNGTACDAGGGTFCSSGNCVAQCFVFDAGLLASGALDPADPNECCVPMASAMGWTAGFALHRSPNCICWAGDSLRRTAWRRRGSCRCGTNANEVELFSGTGTGTFSSGK